MPNGFSNGKPMTLEKISDYVIKLKFDAPNGLILRMLAFHGNQWPMNFERFGFYAPSHFLKQFLPKFNPDMKDYKTFEAEGRLHQSWHPGHDSLDGDGVQSRRSQADRPAQPVLLESGSERPAVSLHRHHGIHPGHG